MKKYGIILKLEKKISREWSKSPLMIGSGGSSCPLLGSLITPTHTYSGLRAGPSLLL